jgi:hypothetical protein
MVKGILADINAIGYVEHLIQRMRLQLQASLDRTP